MAKKAKFRRFNSDDYTRKVECGKGTFFDPKHTINESDVEAYRNDIANFLSFLGPDKIIGVLTPRLWSYDEGKGQPDYSERTDIWYWEEV